MIFPDVKKMQTALLNQAYNSYCYGFEHSKDNKAMFCFAEFCAYIKEVNKQGEKINKEFNLVI